LKNKIKAKIINFLLQRENEDTLDISKINRVLIIRNSGIGDAICMEPMLREFKKASPNIEIDIFASLGNKIIFENIKYVNNVFVKHKKRAFIKRLLEFFKMKNRKYDLLIDTTKYHFDKAIMSYFLNPKWAVTTEELGVNFVDRQQLSFYVKFLPLVESEHIIDKLQRFLTLLDLKIQNNNIYLEIPTQYKEKAREFIQHFNGKKIIGINSDAKDINRTISFEQVTKICKMLSSKGYVILIFSIGKNRDIFNQILKKEKIHNVFLTYETPNIYDAIAIVENIDVMISPDTAYIHIASALNISTVGLFWNNIQKITEWGPRAKDSIVITSDIKGDNTLKNIDLKKVVDEVGNIIDKKRFDEK
jgi:ADP-heptose:LPS heptosyltransferase